jgi:hypothetical protein
VIICSCCEERQYAAPPECVCSTWYCADCIRCGTCCRCLAPRLVQDEDLDDFSDEAALVPE